MTVAAFGVNESALIPIEDGQAVGRGWTSATDGRPVGVTWHWTVTADLALCRQVLGGAHAERKGEASAHYGIGRSFEEGIDRYVSIENRSWHAGINQTLRWDGRPLGHPKYKGSRTTIGVETVSIGFSRRNHPADEGWITTADPTGKFVLQVQPWTEEQVEMMIAVGKEIVERWPNIGFREHHGHHDICPGYKQDVAGFPFARVLRAIYDNPAIPDVWTPLLLPEQRQRALWELGYDIGGTVRRGVNGANGASDAAKGIDGDWGRMSDAALRRFQRDNGMLADGMWTSFVCWKVFERIGGLP